MYLVAGLGVTGKSVLRYFASQGEACLAFDTRKEFETTDLEVLFPECQFATGALPIKWLNKIGTLVLSPGISQSEPWVVSLIQAGISVIGDIELFARAVGVPVVAITGSNGKSTVTTLVAEVLTQAGYQVGVGGNIGDPALDLLHDDQEYDLFVLELSSFQLETTYSLQTISATILNISEDHMDRYSRIEDYIQAKLTILSDTECTVLPKELMDLKPTYQLKVLSFSVQPSLTLGENEFGLIEKAGQVWLGVGKKAILALEDMAQQGLHHQLNALATMALCAPFEVSIACFRAVFSKFTGLPHRTQLTLQSNNIQWINDSKGTNVGATVTAVETFASQTQGKLILLAGGVSKGADFSELGVTLQTYQASAVLFGRDASRIADCIKTSKVLVSTLSEAVNQAFQIAIPGDVVLFSPACASFDQFDNYVQRGEVFEQLVHQLLPSVMVQA